MKASWEFIVNTVVGGLLVIVPIYLAVLLLLKAMQSVMGLVRPFAQSLNLSQFVEGRRWWPWAREDLAEVRVFAGDGL